MNTPIEIGGVRVENGDYIFADEDGVVVIPYRIWSDVKERILEGIEKEWKVGMAVALGIEPKSIIGSYGEF
jgi:regulator of RNase E activity RraA